MKLYNSFKKIIEEIRPIELAWFTTFNLDPELVEKYLISAIGDKEPSELKTAEDYEALNNELRNKNICVLYDYRGLNLQSDKRTTIDLIPVNPTEIYGIEASDSIFHPKVILIKGKTSAYLIVGSANLSISGWSSNCESIIIREIRTQQNANQIINFFGQLGKDIALLNKWIRSLPNSDTDWDFVHSINDKWSLLNHLNKNEEEIIIWSPYFSKKTTTFLNKFKEHGYSKILLVPDINKDGKIRIPPEDISKIKQDKLIDIYRTNNHEEEHRFYHAKVWLTPTLIAVGSWNCSKRATGISIDSTEINIEAGIIEKINSNIYKVLKENLEYYDKYLLKGVKNDDLDKEWENVLNPFIYSCKVIVNWENFRYKFEGEVTNLYKISLPHNPKEIIQIKNINGISFRDNYKRLLKNKLFIVFDENDKEIYQGYIIEEGKEKRPVFSYTSLLDLFESLIENASGETYKKRINYRLPTEDNESNSDTQDPLFEYSGTESYYMMFVSFQKLFDGIIGCAKDNEKLDNIGYRLPGSLINIIELVNDSISIAKVNKKEDTLLYHWFLVCELNRCIIEFNKFSNNPISIINLNELNKLVEFSKKDFRFLNKIKRFCGYEFL